MSKKCQCIIGGWPSELQICYYNTRVPKWSGHFRDLGIFPLESLKCPTLGVEKVSLYHRWLAPGTANLLLPSIIQGSHRGVDTLETLGAFCPKSLKCPHLGGIPSNALKKCALKDNPQTVTSKRYKVSRPPPPSLGANYACNSRWRVTLSTCGKLRKLAHRQLVIGTLDT